MSRHPDLAPLLCVYREGVRVLTFMWFVLIAMTVALCAACDLGKGNRMPGCVSWFALQPFMRESKKAKGRAQQKPKKRKKR